MTLFQAAVATGLGVVTLAVGLIGILRPYRIALWQERLDAMGSTRPYSEIEPTDFRVKLTQLSFLILAIGGVIFLVMAFEEWQEVL